MTARPITIASAQMQMDVDVRANGDHTRELMRQASEAGAGLVLFSEGALSGYVRRQITDWADVDWDALRDELERTAACAEELGLWVVMGCNHRLSGDHRPHNSQYVISDKGELIGRYDKRFCTEVETNDFYTPGFDPFVFEIDGLRFGCAICYEVQFPEIFDEYRRLDADCVLLSVYSNDPMFLTAAQAHAGTNNFWLAFSAPVMDTPPVASHIVGPDGTVVASTEPNTPSVAVATIDRDDPAWEFPVKHVRPWRTSAREGGIYRARRVDDPRSSDKRAF